MNIKELKEIFEYELKRKLAQRSRSPIEELRKLISSLKFFDYSNSMVLDKNQWIRGVLHTGLCGFNLSDLSNIFDQYDPNKTGYINYLNFSRYLYGKEEFMPFKGNQNDNGEKNDNNNKNIDKGQFIPPGLYERNINNVNENENIVENNIIDNNINNNTTLNSKKNYHMKKSQSQIIPQSNQEILKQQSAPNNTNNSLNVQLSPSQLQSQPTKSPPNNNKNYFKDLLSLFRSKININNGVLYYSLAHHLKSKEDQKTHSINIDLLISIFNLLQIDLNPDDIVNFYSILDYTQSDKVSTDEILRLISGEIPEKRKISVISKFAEMDKKKTGYVPINFLKKVYNARFHPDCFLGKKPENEVYDEFMFTFEVFCYIKGLGNEDNISYKDFVEYYIPISASIENDNYFDDILLGTWNLEEDIISPQSQQQPIDNSPNINNNNNANNNNSVEVNDRVSTTNNNIYNNNDIKIEQKTSFQIAQNSYNNSNANLNIRNTPSQYEYQNQHQYQKYNNYSKERKFMGKIQYNPITNEYIMPSTNNMNTLRKTPNKINNINNVSNSIKSNINLNTINIVDIPSLNKLKYLLIKRGMKSIFILQRMLYIYDKNQSGEIPYDKLCDIFEIYNIDITKDDIFEIFNLLDKEHNGFIKYNDLIQILINDTNNNRINLIKYLFDKMSRGKNYIELNDIKKYFKPERYPDVIDKIKTRDEIIFDFFDSIEVFKEYNINLKNENIINGVMDYNDFENYFKEISMSITDDKIFDYVIHFCWEDDDIYKNKYEKKIENNNDNVRIRTGQQIINNQG